MFSVTDSISDRYHGLEKYVGNVQEVLKMSDKLTILRVFDKSENVISSLSYDEFNKLVVIKE